MCHHARDAQQLALVLVNPLHLNVEEALCASFERGLVEAPGNGAIFLRMAEIAVFYQLGVPKCASF